MAYKHNETIQSIKVNERMEANERGRTRAHTQKKSRRQRVNERRECGQHIHAFIILSIIFVLIMAEVPIYFVYFNNNNYFVDFIMASDGFCEC